MRYLDGSSLLIWTCACNVLVWSVSQLVHCENAKNDASSGFEKGGVSLDYNDYDTHRGHNTAAVQSGDTDHEDSIYSSTSGRQVQAESSPLHLYQLLFREKRKSHREAVKAILGLKTYEKQYKMVNLIMEKMFSTTEEAKVFLMEAGFTPGDPFPTNEKMRDAMSMIIENTVFFGDILLHLPDITHDLLKRNKQWDLMARWGISFCNDTKVYEEAELKLLNLMAQELGIIEKDPDYVNPYKSNQKDLQKEIEKLLKDSMDEPVRKKKKKRKEKKRGPRLSSIPHTEL